jgi:hypothetical protein
VTGVAAYVIIIEYFRRSIFGGSPVRPSAMTAPTTSVIAKRNLSVPLHLPLLNPPLFVGRSHHMLAPSNSRVLGRVAMKRFGAIVGVAVMTAALLAACSSAPNSATSPRGSKKAPRLRVRCPPRPSRNQCSQTPPMHRPRCGPTSCRATPDSFPNRRTRPAEEQPET